jgi:hypothetical protein
MGFEMGGAEGSQPFQQGIDLGLGGEEGVQCCGIVSRLLGHLSGSMVARQCVGGTTFARVAKRIN